MSNTVYPSMVRGLTFTSLKTMENDTLRQTSPSKVQTRIAQQSNPLWHWELLYDYMKDNPNDLVAGLSYSDLQTMLGFMAARRNGFDDFLYLDPDDNFVGPGTALGQPNLQAQLQLVNDGAGNYYSPIQRNLGGQFYEDITDLNGGITVYANGSVVSNYRIGFGGLALPGFSSSGLYLQWTSAPTPPITATFNYYFRVCFEKDTQDFEKFLQQLWTIGGSESKNGSGYIKLIGARPQPQAGVIQAPAPPIPFPAGATQRIVLYPTVVTLSQGDPGTASATATSTWGTLKKFANGVGTGQPSAVFSGYSLPASINPASIKAVYHYSADSGTVGVPNSPIQSVSVSWSGGGTGWDEPDNSGNGLQAAYSHLLTMNLGAGSFPVSSVQQKFSFIDSFGGATIGASFTFAPSLVIFY